METWLFIPFVICLVKCINTNNENAFDIMDVLKKHGLTKKPTEGKRPKQFVSVTVLSEDEYTNLSWIKAGTFPESFRNTRVKVQFNENDNKLHGEKIILDRHLNDLTNKMKEDCEIRCAAVVCLFSWYIPCSLAANTCAEKLRKDVNDKNYKLIIGFTEIYWKTRDKSGSTLLNVKNSLNTLAHDNIDVFYLVNFYSGQISKQEQYMKPITSLRKILQSNLYDCIIQKPISFCCGSNYNKEFPGLTDLAQVEKITAFSINTMFYDCSAKIGKTFVWKQSLHKDLRACFSRWIQNNIGTNKDCENCWTKGPPYHYYVEKCINRAFATSFLIGKPHDDEDQSLNIWDEINSQKNRNDLLKPPQKALRCIKGNLHPGTFCTKKDLTYERDKICKQKKIGKTRR